MVLIKDIPLNERPREKFKKHGASRLGDAELLAIILQTGTKGESVVTMCNRLIAKYGLDYLATASFEELQEIRGIGPAKAMQIMVLFEFSKRCNISKRVEIKIKSAKDVFEYAKQVLQNEDKEHFMVLHLNSKHIILKHNIISIGILNSAPVHPREVFKSAIKDSVNSIILVHNHPSGDPEPSLEDIKITKKLVDAGTLLEISVLDHVIVGNGTYYSFKDNDEI
jgi:DNA repair protein RadC